MKVFVLYEQFILQLAQNFLQLALYPKHQSVGQHGLENTLKNQLFTHFPAPLAESVFVPERRNKNETWIIKKMKLWCQSNM